MTCSIMLRIGAKPVPPATKMIGFLHGVENMRSELTIWHQTNVQLQQSFLMRRIGDRESAVLSILEQNLDILASTEGERLIVG